MLFHRMPYRLPPEPQAFAPPVRFFCREPWKIVLMTALCPSGALIVMVLGLWAAATSTLACQRHSGGVICSAVVELAGATWQEEPPFQVSRATVEIVPSRKSAPSSDLVLCERACVRVSGMGPNGSDA
jgi:hypothetical protein